jgi:hypothetical protein
VSAETPASDVEPDHESEDDEDDDDHDESGAM